MLLHGAGPSPALPCPASMPRGRNPTNTCTRYVCRAQGRDPPSPKAHTDPLEGDRLLLNSPGAVDRVRPRARAALILPEQVRGAVACAMRPRCVALRKQG